MSYRDNVEALCKHMGVTNPVEEGVLTFTRLLFFIDGNEFEVRATDMNRAGRLYLQYRLYDMKKNRILTLDTAEKWMAREFFTPELWDDSSQERRQLIYGIRRGSMVIMFPK